MHVNHIGFTGTVKYLFYLYILLKKNTLRILTKEFNHVGSRPALFVFVLSATTVPTVWLHQQKDVRGGHRDTSHRSLPLQSGQRLRRGNLPHCLSVCLLVCVSLRRSAYDCLSVCISVRLYAYIHLKTQKIDRYLNNYNAFTHCFHCTVECYLLFHQWCLLHHGASFFPSARSMPTMYVWTKVFFHFITLSLIVRLNGIL